MRASPNRAPSWMGMDWGWASRSCVGLSRQSGSVFFCCCFPVHAPALLGPGRPCSVCTLITTLEGVPCVDFDISLVSSRAFSCANLVAQESVTPRANSETESGAWELKVTKVSVVCRVGSGYVGPIYYRLVSVIQGFPVLKRCPLLMTTTMYLAGGATFLERA